MREPAKRFEDLVVAESASKLLETYMRAILNSDS